MGNSREKFPTKKNEAKDQKITIVSSSRLKFICSICVQKQNDEYKIKTTKTANLIIYFGSMNILIITLSMNGNIDYEHIFCRLTYIGILFDIVIIIIILKKVFVTK